MVQILAQVNDKTIYILYAYYTERIQVNKIKNIVLTNALKNWRAWISAFFACVTMFWKISSSVWVGIWSSDSWDGRDFGILHGFTHFIGLSLRCGDDRWLWWPEPEEWGLGERLCLPWTGLDIVETGRIMRMPRSTKRAALQPKRINLDILVVSRVLKLIKM